MGLCQLRRFNFCCCGRTTWPWEEPPHRRHGVQRCLTRDIFSEAVIDVLAESKIGKHLSCAGHALRIGKLHKKRQMFFGNASKIHP